MTRPLNGVQIVEVASFVAGPTGGLTLAQLGASVIRIDQLGGGNDYRRWPVVGDGAGPADAESYYWASLNNGKRSVAVDMRSGAGQELVAALVTAPGSDRGVLVDNVVSRPWMSHELLAAMRPDLIHMRVQGYPDGRPAVDYTVNAEVGIPHLTGPESGCQPVNHVLPAWDLLAGLTVATGVLAALHDRTRTGHGAYIELALSDVALAGVANLGWFSEAAARGRDRPRHGNHVYGSFGVDFQCADGHRVMVVALTAKQWMGLLNVTGTASILEAIERALDADLTIESERYRLRDLISAVLKPWFAARNFEYVAAELDTARVLWGHYRSMSDVVASYRQGRHRVLTEVRLQDGSESITSRSPLRWDGEYGQPGLAPILGADSEIVLAEVLGLSSREISRLRDRGVIGTAQVVTKHF
jgi:2-methylfumaryl-CoA isomerase